jgi:glycosyltransferase involved in cell wall biosynthesis
MKVAVASAAVPFVRGGAELLEEELVKRLRDRGLDVVHLRLPFAWRTPSEVRRCMAGAAALRLPDDVDLLLALKFPAWLVPHNRTVAWVFHQFRQVYDLWEAGLAGWSAAGESEFELRRLVTQADTNALATCEKVFTYSSVTQQRLRRFNGIESALLYTPLPRRVDYPHQTYDGPLVALGRVCAAKRQHLAVEALALTRRPVEIVIAGRPDPVEYGVALSERIRDLNLKGRATLIDRFITDAEKADLLGRSLGSVYLPLDEDNFGYVTAEAFLARRPVITTTDSGGVRWLVRDRVSGLVVDPEPAALAAAFDWLYDARADAPRMGAAGQARLAELRLDWDHTIESLLT